MNSKALKPRQALNKAYLKVKPSRSDIEGFKAHLIQLLDRSNDKESEEFHKNLVSDFLKDTYYKKSYFINTKGRNDLVVHNGADAQSTVGVIIEAKKPTNKAEMVSQGKLNAKAFQELVLYYLRERITHKNIEVRHLVITNIYEWYIFDATFFDRYFAQNKALVKQYQDFEAGRLAESKTDFFYKQIAEPAIAEIKGDLEYTYFDLHDYQKAVRNTDKEDDNQLIALYKLLSPEHLLKLPFANDSNSLDKRFYSELLHIIGLTESKEGSKKLIGRHKEADRHLGTLLESTINQLDAEDRIRRIEKPGQFGANLQERLYNVALELTLTWINRILFLKLLEAQLISYHKGDKAYAFLNGDKIKSYDDLNGLFFQVLARKHSDRQADVKAAFDKVPYLNSSLFEPTDIEQTTLFISNLRDDRTIPIFGQTVLKDDTGKKRSGQLSTLGYLFQFLDAYDFGSEGSEDIQEDNKSLINASVLGLIFEKINGYKDGSFFTPGFITMYMCRETIRRAVVQKFNEAKQWNCENFDELYDKIEDRKEANNIVNTLHICDPAVGSGHFLVSALNEVIAIKNDLKILQDRDGKRLKEYHVEVVNDELIVTDEDGGLFEYKPGNKESQRIQETLFHEKQTIIENCLFGVDINPNSVKICRLRLWIELLKNAYYKNERELETLPNIDINIKCGNSLVSRFAIDADLGQALKKSKWTIDDYRIFVDTYRNAENKEQKREMEQLIETIKSDFRSEISLNDPKMNKLRKLRGELFNLTNQTQLFDRSPKELAEWEKQVKKLQTEIEALEKEIEEIKANKIYENAFEWRFEFPEVLNDKGDFVGFDVVIGNPPYMRIQEIEKSQAEEKKYYEANYSNAKASYDLANLFFEMAVNISCSWSKNSFIFPHKFFNSASATVFRKYLIDGMFIDKIAHFGANMIFEDADTYTCVTFFSKAMNEGFYFQKFPFKSDFQKLMLINENYGFITYSMLQNASKLYGNNQWIMFGSKAEFNLFNALYLNSVTLENCLDGIFVGLQTSNDKLFVLENCIVNNGLLTGIVPISNKKIIVESNLFKPFLMGKDIQRYSDLKTNKYVFFPYIIENEQARVIDEDEIKKYYPLTYTYIKDHENHFKSRESGKASKMKNWYAYIYPKNLNKFEKIKLSSMEICANHPNVTLNKANFYHTTKVYSWVKKDYIAESYEYFLGLANSKVLWWFLKLTGDTLQGDARTFKTNYLNPFPVPKLIDPQLHDKITDKVTEILDIKSHHPELDTNKLENDINLLVYQLYNLTKEEINIIEKHSYETG